MREIVVLGRRGPAQAAFTNPEVRELGEMVDADIVVDPDDCELDEHSHAWLEAEADITARKNVEIFTDFSGRAPENKNRRIFLRFLRSPVEIQGDGRVERVIVAVNELYLDDLARCAPATPASARRSSAAWCCARSATAARASRAFPSTSAAAMISNQAGRVTDPGSGEQVPGQYAVGWIKRGPSGVIGTNKKDAQETVDNLVEDLEAGRIPEPAVDRDTPGREAEDVSRLDVLLAQRKPDAVVSYRGWEAIDAAEKGRGEPQGRPRVKFCRVDEMLEASRSGQPVGAE